MTTNEIKALLKQNGINTKLVRVSQERSTINVKLLSYEVDRVKVETLLSDLNTVKNVSHDWDPIYIGTSVNVSYRAEVNDELKAVILAGLKDMDASTFRSVLNYGDVQRASRILKEQAVKFSHLSQYDFADLIHTVGPR